MQEFTSEIEGWVPKPETESETIEAGGVTSEVLDSFVWNFDIVYPTKERAENSVAQKIESKKVKLKFKLQVTVEEIE